MSSETSPVTLRAGRAALLPLLRDEAVAGSVRLAVAAIETEAWNAALTAVEEAVGGMDGVLGSGASVSRNSVLSRIAALRKGA